VHAILIQAVVASLLVLLGTFQQILSYFIFIAVAFLGLTVAGLFVVRSRKHEASGVILTLGYPVTPVLFISLVILLLVLLLAHEPREPLLGTSVVLMGLPVYNLIQRRMIQLGQPADKVTS
jgi:APA family basic amino acid/polyamine antiporter